MLRYFDFTQGSREWHEWRRGGVGGSDAPEIMGVGWLEGGASALLGEKLSGVQREETFAMRRGKTLEVPARALFNARHGLALRPACVSREDTPWMQASLDGLDLWGEIPLEVKCPNVTDHEVALAGVVPHHYKPQVQHLLMVTEAPLLYYASYSIANRFGGKDKPSLAVVEVLPDAEYQATLAAAELAFYERMRKLGPLVAEAQQRMRRLNFDDQTALDWITAYDFDATFLWQLSEHSLTNMIDELKKVAPLTAAVWEAMS
jgi:putative phage-type endonuclease